MHVDNKRIVSEFFNNKINLGFELDFNEKNFFEFSHLNEVRIPKFSLYINKAHMNHQPEPSAAFFSECCLGQLFFYIFLCF